MGLGGNGNDVTFTVDGTIPSSTGNGNSIVNTSSGSLDRSQTNSLAVDDPSILPNAFSSTNDTNEAIAKDTKADKAGAKSPNKPQGAADVNHNTSNGCAKTAPMASEVTIEDTTNGSLE